MKKIIFLLGLCVPLVSIGQEKGINWTTGLSWLEVVEKAKAQNKCIFLDLYATWCGPCHAMDKDVYPNKEIGDTYNQRFISVKVQMDKTNYDDDNIKKWYSEAGKIQKNYSVSAFPTFLFFFPDGKPMHRAVGYRKPEEFIELASDALSPQKQYYALLQNYKPGKIDTSELKGLARALKRSGGELATDMAIEYLSRIPKSQLGAHDNISLMIDFKSNSKIQEIAATYLSMISPKKYKSEANLNLIRQMKGTVSIQNLVFNYFDKLKSKEIGTQLSLLTVFDKVTAAKSIADRYINNLNSHEIYTIETLQFISSFTKKSSDKGFKIYMENQGRIDKVLGFKGAAQSTIFNVIIEEEYNSFYKDAITKDMDNIPWGAIADTVRNKYGEEIAQKLDVHLKASLYEYFAKKKNKYWAEYIRYYIDKIEKNGYDTTHPQIQFIDVVQLNNFVYDAIFYHSNDPIQFEIGLKWMEGVIRRNSTEANNIDTYANLLYKAGRKEEAILWQTRAVQIATEQKQDWVLPSIQANLIKMEKGEPTWIKE